MVRNPQRTPRTQLMPPQISVILHGLLPDNGVWLPQTGVA